MQQRTLGWTQTPTQPKWYVLQPVSQRGATNFRIFELYLAECGFKIGTVLHENRQEKIEKRP